MKIKFVQRPSGGRDYEVGEEVEFAGRVEEGYAQKFIDRGWAVDISPKVSEATAEEVEAQRLADEAAAEAQRLRPLASSVTDGVVKSKDDAAKAIETELKRRAG